jgi:hypothetical protein
MVPRDRQLIRTQNDYIRFGKTAIRVDNLFDLKRNV